MDKHYVTTRFITGMAFEARVGDHDVLMDAGPSDGGIDSGPSPKKLMLTSLAGCTGIDIVSILNKMKVAFTDFRIDIEATLSEDAPKIYKRVKLIYHIKLAEAEKPKMERAVELSEEKYCGVMAMFKAFAVVEKDIMYS